MARFSPAAHSRAGPSQRPARLCRLATLALCAAGCATTNIDQARRSFYAGHPHQADVLLNTLDASGLHHKDEVLYLMERGMIRQCAGDYEGSAEDFIRATDRLEELETYSVSKDGTSLIVNDTVQSFKGRPYERSLLHAFAAQSHMAMGHWNDAGVEARRLLQTLDPERRGDHPDVAYGRYIAGFCLALTDDQSNAEIQFQKAAELAPTSNLVTSTGAFLVTDPKAPTPGAEWPNELVCFVAMGRAHGGWAYTGPTTESEQTGYAEFYHKGRYMGRSYTLDDTTILAARAEQADALRTSAKTGARIAIKEGLALTVDANTDGSGWGDLTRLILIGLLEHPDTRNWNTLPRWLQVARMPCPPDLQGYDVVFKNPSGHTTMSTFVAGPLEKHRNIYVSMCRDLRIERSTAEQQPVY